MIAPSTPPPAHLKDRMCGFKKRLGDRAIAEHVIQRLRAKRKIKPGETMNCYLCPFCGFYHIGHGTGGQP